MTTFRPDDALLTDLYQLTMLQAYFDRGMREDAVFEFFVRRLPPERNFLIAAGLEQALDYLEHVSFDAKSIEALRGTELFHDRFLDHLAGFRFTGHVEAMAEGTVFFANEPILRVVAPLPEAQLVESRLVNILHFQTLIASKAARCVLAAPGKRLVDFGMRRAHGREAAIHAARASYIAGFDGTSLVEALPMFGIPIVGTMAHSFIQAHDDELEAFEHFANSHLGGIVLLIDTYDTETGARRVAELARRMPDKTIQAVRLDSGDLGALAHSVRKILDDAGCADIGMFASGSIDEYKLEALLRDAAPIDGFGIGTALDVSSDCPALDCVYKMEEYAGRARRKRSTGKETWPGRKQVFRSCDAGGLLSGDVLTILGDEHAGTPLLEPVMRDGQPMTASPGLDSARERTRSGLASLPEELRSLDRHADYLPRVADALLALTEEVDRGFG
jgi:nicotinate phosphoribosyltransferase